MPTATLRGAVENFEGDALNQLAETQQRAAAAEERIAELTQAFEELTKAHEVLRRSVSRLVNAADLDVASIEAVRAAAEVVEAHSGALGVFSTTERGFRTRFLLVDGELTPLHSLGFESRLYSLDEEPIRLAWEQFTTGESVLWCPLGSPYLTDDSRDFLVSRGLRSSVLVGVKQGETCIGYLGFATRLERDLTHQQRDLLKMIADQTSLMLELSRLARLSEEAAVSQEREKAAQQRAAEFAKVNEALRRGVDRISADNSVSAVVSSFLAEALQAVDAAGGAVMMRVPDKQNTFRVAAAHESRPITQDVIDASPYLSKYVELSSFDPGRIFTGLSQGECPSIAVEHLREVFPEAYAYHHERCHKIIWHAPLRLRGELIGFIGIAFLEERLPSDSNEEAIAALGQQLVLALEFQRISAEVEQSTIAREQEKSAQQRVADLIKANRVLKESVQAVARSDGFDQSLSEVVLRIAECAGAKEGHLFTYDPVANTLCIEFWFEDGVAHWGIVPTAPEVLRRPFNADITPAFRMYLSEPRMVYANLEAIDDTLRALSWPGVIDWHLARGRKAAAAIPILVGERALGLLGLAWGSQTAFSEEQLEVLTALSNHATLVMQLRQMERNAREQAVSLEKDRATTEERTRIAREMHDTLLQGFAGVTMQLRAIAKQLRSSDGQSASEIDRALNESVAAMHEARRAVGDMRGEQTKQPSLIEMIAGLLSAERQRNTGITVHLNCLSDLSGVTEEMTENLFRIVREAFRNAVQHAKADCISVEIQRRGNRLELRVIDDGFGFDVEDALRSAGHWGLTGMRERAAALGGGCDIQSEPGQGSRISVEVPIHG